MNSGGFAIGMEDGSADIGLDHLEARHSNREFGIRERERQHGSSSLKHSTSYLGGHAPAGSGAGPSHRSQRRPDSKELRSSHSQEVFKPRKTRTFKKRDADLHRLLEYKSFENDPIRREEVNRVLHTAVEKLRAANEMSHEEFERMKMKWSELQKSEFQKRLTFYDNSLTVLDGILPIETDQHVQLLK